ncbi:uncharacterized protein B0H18DRAFT_1115727 [Fomitopsis serialis]|uniref:uncharacterized protein n=1 Tax=Fomitopsis serialis TaxID=139415 RepID=UPI002007418D|nr:uncharacterized protein B0H18DRAFT_1115727 [Neoantrodia serialis]KAH9932467.1 hypothetical protein B0H18DRAFT_1115727 [Neoantrodia serialis]
MRATYLVSLTRHDAKANAVANLNLTNVAYVQPVTAPRSNGGPCYADAYTGNLKTPAWADEARRVAVEDNATPPDVAAASSRTRRVPDYGMMPFMTPQEMVMELWKPSIAIVEPIVFAAPRPTRPPKVDRANISAIVDHDWEVWRGGVRLRITKQGTVNDDHPVSDHVQPYSALCLPWVRVVVQEDSEFASWPPFLPHRCETVPPTHQMSSGLAFPGTGTLTLQNLVTDDLGSEPVDANEESNVCVLSEGSDSSSDTASSFGRDDGFCVQGREDWAYGPAIVEPIVMKTADGPLRECDWIDCPFCPSSVGEAIFSKGDANSLTGRAHQGNSKGSPKESGSRARASGRSRRRAGSSSSGKKRASAKTRHVETGCIPAREKGTRALPSKEDISSCPRPCDWFDCLICEQTESAATTARRKNAGQCSAGETTDRKPSDRRTRRNGGGEFHRVAVMLGLVPEL